MPLISSKEAEVGRYCEFKASLVYVENSRTARTTERNPVSKKPKTNPKTTTVTTTKQTNNSAKQIKKGEEQKKLHIQISKGRRVRWSCGQ